MHVSFVLGESDSRGSKIFLHGTPLENWEGQFSCLWYQRSRRRNVTKIQFFLHPIPLFFEPSELAKRPRMILGKIHTVRCIQTMQSSSLFFILKLRVESPRKKRRGSVPSADALFASKTRLTASRTFLSLAFSHFSSTQNRSSLLVGTRGRHSRNWWTVSEILRGKRERQRAREREREKNYKYDVIKKPTLERFIKQ